MDRWSKTSSVHHGAQELSDLEQLYETDATDMELGGKRWQGLVGSFEVALGTYSVLTCLPWTEIDRGRS